MAPRHASVRQPELGVLSAAHDVGAFAQLVGPAAAVIELQGHRGSGRSIADLPVTAVATRRLPVFSGGRLAVVVFAVDGLGIAGARRCVPALRAFGVLGVIGLRVLRPAVSLAPLLITRVVSATIGVARPLFGLAVTTLLRASGSASSLGIVAVPAIARLATATLLTTGGGARRGVAAARAIGLVAVAGGGRRTLLIGRWWVATCVLIPGLWVRITGRLLVAALFLVAARVGVSRRVGVAAALLGIAALVGIPALLWIAALVGMPGRGYPCCGG